MASKYIIIVEDDGSYEPLIFEDIEKSIRIDLDAGLILKNIYEFKECNVIITTSTITIDGRIPTSTITIDGRIKNG